MNKFCTIYFCLFIFIIFSFVFTGCTSDYTTENSSEIEEDNKISKYDVLVPYSSDEYGNGDWTADELVQHFEELGFYDIKIEETASRHVDKETVDVKVEEYGDGLFSYYRGFEKNEVISKGRIIKLIVTKPIPVMTVENCPELVGMLQMRNGSEGDIAVWNSFLADHVGEFIEFDGTVTSWYDEMWWVSISFTVCFEEYEDITFSFKVDSTKEIGFADNYFYGCVEKGAAAHLVLEIVKDSDGYYKFEIDSIQLEHKTKSE